MFKLGFRPDSVSGDKAHGESRVYKELLALGIKPFIPHQNFRKSNPNIWPQEKFRYDAEHNCYICPNGKVLWYQGHIDRRIMKVYQARPQDCKVCPYKSQRTTARRVGRTIKRHVDPRVFEMSIGSWGAPKHGTRPSGSVPDPRPYLGKPKSATGLEGPGLEVLSTLRNSAC